MELELQRHAPGAQCLHSQRHGYRSWLSTRAAKCLRGNITSKLRMGPNLLIKQGAKLIQDWNDVVAELPVESRRHLIQQGRQRILGEGVASGGRQPASLVDGLGPEFGPVARRTLEALKVDAAVHLDDLLELVQDTSTSELIAALFELEMLGLVKQLPGKNFVKVW